MRGARAISLLAAVLLLTAAGGQRDVNRDGRVDLADVRALARMVAGLDPPDLAFDQNGDGALTVEDVSLLSDVADIGSEGAPAGTPAAAERTAPAATPTPPPPPPTPSADAAQYLVVQQAGDGRIVVVVGTRGVRAGDRILGLYSTLAEATAERTRLAATTPAEGSRGVPLAALPRATPAPAQAPPAPSQAPPGSVTLAASPIPQLAGTTAVIPLAPGRALAAGAGWHDAWLVEASGGGGDATVTLQPRPLSVLAGLDPALSPPCARFDRPGHADALVTFLPATGDVRLIPGLDGRERLRALRVAVRPTLEGSGGILVLPRLGDGGVTVGVYLYHWPSGTALYAPGLDTGARHLRARRLPGFPATRFEPVVLGAPGRSAATRAFAVLDPASGGVWSILDVEHKPSRPRNVSTAVDLARLAPAGSSARLSLAAARLLRPGQPLAAALLADGGSGRLGVLEGYDDPAAIRLRVVDATLDDVLPPTAGARRLFAVTLSRPDHVLVLDGSSGRLAEVAVEPGGGVRIRPATVAR